MKFDFFPQRLKILKIVNSPQAIKYINTILKYFEIMNERLCDTQEYENIPDSLENNHSLAHRAKIIKKMLHRKEKSFANLMKQIANDEK